VVALFNTKQSPEFLAWCTEEIQKIPTDSQLDVPTVVSFLCDVPSPYDLKDYIHEVFGDNEAARNFGDEFLKRRDQSQQGSTQTPSTGAAPVPSRELVTGKTKRGKRSQRKLQLCDPSILGFSVNAASDRVNMGEIDTPDT